MIVFFHEYIDKDKIHVYLLIGYGGESYVTFQEGVRRGRERGSLSVSSLLMVSLKTR